MNERYPPARLQLDGAALVANWRFMARQSSAACGAAVKADGYGLGARAVVAHLRDAGCRDFFVAHWAEATAIADLVPPEQIAVLNGIDERDVTNAREIGALPVLNTPRQIALWKVAGGGRCHVMLDTGINRLGIGPEQLSADLLSELDIEIMMSHLASADQDSEQNTQQLAAFCEMSAGVNAARRSLANSAGIGLGPDYHFDLTRPGIALYGGVVRPELAGHIVPVAQLAARILQVRELSAGDPIGYNATHICAVQTRVATLALGYADGYLRAFSAIGSASAEGVELPVLGRVSMDLTTVDISAARHLSEGDWVEIDYELPAASSATGLSQYELLTILGTRLERCWI